MIRIQRSSLALPVIFFICGIGVHAFIFLSIAVTLFLLLVVLWHYQKVRLTLSFGNSFSKSIMLFLLFFSAGFLVNKMQNEQAFALKESVNMPLAKVRFTNGIRFTTRGAWTTAQLLCDSVEINLQVNLDSAKANLIERGDTFILKNVRLSLLVKEGKVASGFEEYLMRQGVMAKVYINDNCFVANKKNKSWKYLFYNYLHAKILHSKLTKNSKSMLLSLLIGDRGYINKATKNNFSALGVSHILSVSGLHVGIIYLILAFIISLVWNKHAYLSLTFILLFIWFYCWMVGFEAAVLRSALMFSLYAIGNSIGRKSTLLHTTALSALIILTINPSFLYDIGFQLTYGAMLGIIFILPIFQDKVSWQWAPLKAVSDLILLSIAVQITLLPFLIYHFQNLSVYFIFANLLVVPAVALIMYAGILFLAIPENEILNFIIDLLMMINDSCCAWMGEWPYTMIYTSNISLLSLSLYSYIVVQLILYYSWKLNAFLWLAVFTLAALLI